MSTTDVFPSQIPLFPFPLVLFPGQVKQLHIFEPRYRHLLQHCLSSESPFGIVLANPSKLDEPEPLPCHIGTLAHIVQFARQEDGAYGIQLYGGERFQISGFKHDAGYLQGSIVPHPLANTESDAAYALHQVVGHLLEDYLEALTEASGVRFHIHEIPPEPEQLAYLAAIILQINNDRKQALLAATHLPDLLIEEAHLLVDDLDLMSWIGETIEVEQTRGFGTGNWLSVN